MLLILTNENKERKYPKPRILNPNSSTSEDIYHYSVFIYFKPYDWIGVKTEEVIQIFFFRPNQMKDNHIPTSSLIIRIRGVDSLKELGLTLKLKRFYKVFVR